MSNIGHAYPNSVRVSQADGAPSAMLTWAAGTLDALVLVASSVLAQLTYAGLNSGGGAEIAEGLVASLVCVPLNKALGQYSFAALAFPRRLGFVLLVTFVGVLADLSLLFLLHDLDHRSRGAWVLFALYAPALTVATRLAFGWFVHAAAGSGLLRGRRVVLVGDVEEMAWLTREDLLHFGITDIARFAVAGAGGAAGGLSSALARRRSMIMAAAA